MLQRPPGGQPGVQAPHHPLVEGLAVLGRRNRRVPAGLDIGDARLCDGDEFVLRLEALGVPADGVLEELLPARGPALRDLPLDDAPEVVGQVLDGAHGGLLAAGHPERRGPAPAEFG